MKTDSMEVVLDYEKHSYFQHLDMDLSIVEQDKVSIRLNIQDHHLNTNGTLHGGVSATLLDFIQSSQLRAVTGVRCHPMNSTVYFTAPIKTGWIYAEAAILSKGYKTAFVEGVIKDEAGNLISKGVSTFQITR